VPTGGTTSQVLTKTSSTDYATAWQTPSPGLTLPLGQNLTFSPDNTYDIGGSSSTLRPRNVYVGTSFLAPDGSAAVPSYSFASTPNTGLYYGGGSNLQITSGGVGVARFIYSGGVGYLGLGTSVLAWAAALNGGSDLLLYRDAANTLAQRNGTSPQTFRIYNTYTDASNYERLGIGWNGTQNGFLIVPEGSGTGLARNLLLWSGASGNLYLGNGGASKWLIAGSGHLWAQSDNAYDIGQNATSNRPRNGFFAGAVATGGKAGAAVDGDVNSPSDGMLRFDSTNNRLYVRISGTWRYAALT
jgi:hypothetical protein